MKFSQEINELAAALSAAQGEFRTLVKDKSNPFFKSVYANLTTHVEMIRPILVKHNLAYSQGVETVEGQEKLATMIMHKSGQWLISYSPWFAIEQVEKSKDGQILRRYVKPQDAGSGTTYSRRYGLAAAFGIVADDGMDDDGNAANGNKPKKVEEEPF